MKKEKRVEHRVTDKRFETEQEETSLGGYYSTIDEEIKALEIKDTNNTKTNDHEKK